MSDQWKRWRLLVPWFDLCEVVRFCVDLLQIDLFGGFAAAEGGGGGGLGALFFAAGEPFCGVVFPVVLSKKCGGLFDELHFLALGPGGDGGFDGLDAGEDVVVGELGVAGAIGLAEEAGFGLAEGVAEVVFAGVGGDE